MENGSVVVLKPVKHTEAKPAMMLVPHAMTGTTAVHAGSPVPHLKALHPVNFAWRSATHCGDDGSSRTSRYSSRSGGRASRSHCQRSVHQPVTFPSETPLPPAQRLLCWGRLWVYIHSP